MAAVWGLRLLAPALLVGLPLLGAWLAGKPLAPYLEFPPRTEYLPAPGFAWPAALAAAVLVLAALLPFVIALWRARPAPRPPATRPMPWWGWLGLAWLVLWWVLAWTRPQGLGVLREHTFMPLWLGYIVVVNALTWRRRGQALLLRRPGYLLALFPLSAAYWWFFEYANRFVLNWHYLGVTDKGALAYFVHATLPFATVLPAVLSTHAYLRTFPGLHHGLAEAWRPKPLPPRPLGGAVLVLAGAGLAGLAAWPTLLFPLVWVAPLLVIVGLQGLSGQPTVLAPVLRGDWSGLWLAALAALACGFFWELWNSLSYPKWIYTVPYVQGAQVFEMPLLGYAGYLPFGLECLAIAGLYLGPVRRGAKPE